MAQVIDNKVVCISVAQAFKPMRLRPSDVASSLWDRAPGPKGKKPKYISPGRELALALRIYYEEKYGPQRWKVAL
jgi:hypothetical protein